MKRRKLDQSVTTNTPWPDLLPELWTYIAQHLESTLDKARFRSVCKLWRSSLPPLAAFVPTLIPSPWGDHKGYDTFVTFNYMLQERTVYLVRVNSPFSSDKDTVMVLEQVSHDDDKTVVKFRRNTIFDRKIINNNFYFCKKMNMVNNDSCFSMSYMSKFYTIRPSSNKLDKYHDEFNLKLWKIAVVEDVVLAITGNGELIVLRLSCGDAMQWTKIQRNRKFDDVVEYKGNFFVVDRYGRGFILDRNKLILSQIVAPILDRTGICKTEIKGYQFTLRRKRLVFDCVTGRLYLLIAWKFMIGPSRVVHVPVIKVYQFSSIDSEWIEVGNIDNSVLFVGCDFSFCAHARDMIPCLRYKSNCIYFDGDLSFDYYKDIKRPCRTLFKEPNNVDDLGVHVYDIIKGRNHP